MTDSKVFTYNIPFEELDVSADKILKFAKHGDTALHQYSYNYLDEFLKNSSDKAEVKGGFVYIENERLSVSRENFKIDSTEFLSWRIITARLRRAESAALFAVTAGSYFENYSKKLIAEGDVFSGYLIDAAASEIAEAGAEWIENKIDGFAEELSLRTTRRYSPGYCSWHVSEQHKLFSFLPEGFCGIKLTESALMIPVKSVSGIIGMGKNVQKEEYECAVCDDENCFRRNI